MTTESTAGQATLSRRTLLGGLALGLGAGAATACAPVVGRSTPSPSVTGPAVTARTLLAGQPFYVAHRGGGGDWPEMTGYAYEQSSALPGLRALEISVCRSADGVLVCSHDETTQRTTGVPYVIAEQTWDTLSGLEVLPAGTTDPAQPARPLTRLDDVIERYADRYVLFLEPKVQAAVDPLLARMTALHQPERMVWKQYVNSPDHARAKSKGFSTWGYVLDEPGHTGENLQRYAASSDLDLLGAPLDQSDEFIGAVVQAAAENGKPTVAWPVSSAADRDRALRLGVSGLMTSTIAELLPRG